MRSTINYNTLKVGMKLKVHPNRGSHSKTPYIVEVVESTQIGFTTKLASSEIELIKRYNGGHERYFSYSAGEWDGYHKNRFEIIK